MIWKSGQEPEAPLLSRPYFAARSCRRFDNASINAVPGVIAFLSKRGSFVSAASTAARKRRIRCWRIFAIGATPSIAINTPFVGSTCRTTFIVYRATSFRNFSSQLCGACGVYVGQSGRANT